MCDVVVLNIQNMLRLAQSTAVNQQLAVCSLENHSPVKIHALHNYTAYCITVRRQKYLDVGRRISMLLIID